LTHKSCLGKYTIDGCFSAISYNKTSKKLIYNFKYNPYLLDLRKFLSSLLYESLVQNESFNRVLQSSKTWIFVPIPLYPTKLRNRGYNQSEILAKELSKELDFASLGLLKRVKKTQTQVGLKLEERKKNIKGAFEINSSLIINHSELKNAYIFLVDDIVTTGSTLLEAANTLKRQGAGKVYGITLARD
ncbi:MAG TPA: phosphoribosyltransferase family protein, partial [Patescibacteria group bacterium]|nr:phosphoribosyltransferase family protein [Patescibacteria group bacterium]